MLMDISQGTVSHGSTYWRPNSGGAWALVGHGSPPWEDTQVEVWGRARHSAANVQERLHQEWLMLRGCCGVWPLDSSPEHFVPWNPLGGLLALLCALGSCLIPAALGLASFLSLAGMTLSCLEHPATGPDYPNQNQPWWGFLWHNAHNCITPATEVTG